MFNDKLNKNIKEVKISTEQNDINSEYIYLNIRY
jgi:hypothetical protein